MNPFLGPYYHGNSSLGIQSCATLFSYCWLKIKINNPSEIKGLSDVRPSVMAFKLDSNPRRVIEVSPELLETRERTIEQKTETMPLAPNDI